MFSPQFIQFITYHLVVFEDFIKDVQDLYSFFELIITFQKIYLL